MSTLPIEAHKFHSKGIYLVSYKPTYYQHKIIKNIPTLSFLMET